MSGVWLLVSGAVGTLLLCCCTSEAFFEADRALVRQRRVKSDWVVKSLDVVDGTTSGVIVALVLASVNLLAFKALKEALHRRVIVAVALTTHTLQVAALKNPISVSETSELGASITMNN